MAATATATPAGKITVRMLTNIAGTPAYHNGDIVHLDERIALAWIEEGMAVVHRADAPVERAVTR